MLGWKALYVPEAKGFHRRGWKKGSRGAIPLRIRRYSYINRYKMMLKNDRLLEFLKQCIPLLMYELPSLLYFLVREP
ncbi:glycosyl transferase [Paenibacillus mucilaginosus 3016]|uniref:Glycosyl transferase n=1 Tax=Paenibacillus mucilaginosus 3016 TaxID=1116391 RepID=H6NSY3_9BACL|nr:glycosyl transferase [Paenibacillus mucilaginosus 3016]